MVAHEWAQTAVSKNNHQINLTFWTYRERDEEILRNLYSRAFDKQAAYDAMKFKIKYQTDHFPILIDNNTAELMNQGVFYIYGRDRCFRPIVHINA